MRVQHSVCKGSVLDLAGLFLIFGAASVALAQNPADLERDVSDALKEATTFHDQAKKLDAASVRQQIALVKAEAAVQRAEVLLKYLKTEPAAALKRQAQELKSALQDLDKDRRMLERLDEIRLQTSADDPAAAEKTYAEAFRQYGLPLEETEAEKAAARLRSSPGAVREAVVAALDHWALLTKDAKIRARLLKLVRLADPDPWRDKVRDASVWQDRPALERLAADTAAVQQPPEVLVTLSRLLRRVGADPLPFLRAAQLHHPADFGISFELGNALFRERPEEAIGFYRAALASQPRSAAVLNNLGNALQGTGDLHGAIAAYRHVLQLDPKDARAHLNLGTALLAKGSVNEALAACHRAIELDPTNARAHVQLGDAFANKWQLDEAVAAYRQSIRLDPGFAGGYSALGKALFAKGQLDEAIAAYRRALELDPRDARSFVHLGTLLRDKGFVDEALASFRQAAQLNPRHAPAHYQIGNVLLTKKDVPGALEAHRRAVESDPQVAFRSACATARAAYAQSGEAERSALRQQALAWLQADLAARAKQVQEGKDAADARKALASWREEPALAGVREEAALAKLPDAERAAWRKLWADVDALLK